MGIRGPSRGHRALSRVLTRGVELPLFLHLEGPRMYRQVASHKAMAQRKGPHPHLELTGVRATCHPPVVLLRERYVRP